MDKILVTGNAGFIGSHLADYLIETGHEVWGIDNLSTGKFENINPSVKFIQGDLCNKKKTQQSINKIKPDYVFHFAALARIQPSIEDPITWNLNNANATLNLLEACRQVGTVQKFVYSSSSSIYGDNKIPFKENQEPRAKHPYGLAKLHGEQWCKLYSELYGLDTTVLRYFNVYGPRQVLEGDYATVVGIFIKQKEENKPLTIVGDGKQKRDLTYVKDVVMANVKASQSKGFGIYNVGTGKNYEIRNIAKMIQPDTTKHMYGIVRRAEAKVTKANNRKAKKYLKWHPQHYLEEGIELTKEHRANEIYIIS